MTSSPPDGRKPTIRVRAHADSMARRRSHVQLAFANDLAHGAPRECGWRRVGQRGIVEPSTISNSQVDSALSADGRRPRAIETLLASIPNGKVPAPPTLLLPRAASVINVCHGPTRPDTRPRSPTSIADCYAALLASLLTDRCGDERSAVPGQTGPDAAIARPREPDSRSLHRRLPRTAWTSAPENP